MLGVWIGTLDASMVGAGLWPRFGMRVWGGRTLAAFRHASMAEASFEYGGALGPWALRGGLGGGSPPPQVAGPHGAIAEDATRPRTI